VVGLVEPLPPAFCPDELDPEPAVVGGAGEVVEVVVVVEGAVVGGGPVGAVVADGGGGFASVVVVDDEVVEGWVVDDAPVPGTVLGGGVPAVMMSLPVRLPGGVKAPSYCGSERRAAAM
jgi:hypothetical protein